MTNNTAARERAREAMAANAKKRDPQNEILRAVVRGILANNHRITIYDGDAILLENAEGENIYRSTDEDLIIKSLPNTNRLWFLVDDMDGYEIGDVELHRRPMLRDIDVVSWTRSTPRSPLTLEPDMAEAVALGARNR